MSASQVAPTNYCYINQATGALVNVSDPALKIIKKTCGSADAAKALAIVENAKVIKYRYRMSEAEYERHSNKTCGCTDADSCRQLLV